MKRQPKSIPPRPFPDIPKTKEELENQLVQIRDAIESILDEKDKEQLQKIFLERRSFLKYMSQ